ncbi:MAG: conjugative transfer ATPase [Geminicoccaceae bacterium]
MGLDLDKLLPSGGVRSGAPTFTDYLPWMEYDPLAKTFLLEDGRSVGAVYEIDPVGTEGRSEDYKETLRQQTVNLIADTIPEIDPNPWVLQAFVSDEFHLDDTAQAIADYGEGHGVVDSFARSYRQLATRQLTRVCKEGGLFKEEGSDTPWRGRRRRVRLVLYRRHGRSSSMADVSPDDELNDLCAKMELALCGAGLRFKRYRGRDFYRWMLTWLNPKPACAEGDPGRLLDQAPYPGDENLPFGRDFSEMLCLSPPTVDPAQGIVFLDGLPHQVVTTQGIRTTPNLGHFTGEQRRSDLVYCLMDQMPENTILTMTIVFQPQDLVTEHVGRIQDASVGKQTGAMLAAEEAADVKIKMGHGDKLYPAELTFFVRGQDTADLRRQRNRVVAQLVANGIQPINHDQEQLLLDRWFGNLPMAFRAELCEKNRRSRFMFSSHLAAMLPVYGRSRGTGSPGLLFFNRGAEPLLFDPLNPSDRKKNGHSLILGPTGAGKSALLVYLIMQMMAAYRPRIYLVEVGNSFGLLADHFERHGLKVNQMHLNMGADISLPPFAAALDLLDRGADPELTEHPSPRQDDEHEELDRDILGEMEITAELMITGGDEREVAKFARSDRLVIRTAIVDAAKAVADKGRDTVQPSDVVAAMRTLAADAGLTDQRRDRIREMADSMDLITEPKSLGGQLFNRPGKPWPEADVTLVDLATLAREGYESELAITYVSLMNHINHVVERHQHERRQTLVITDEGHIITTNPLLSRYVVKITKMWRKLGAWYWLATQNLEDFPAGAKRMLNMMEWWLCLVMPKEEVDNVARFRELGEETKRLLLDARKEPGRYVEGVVLSDQMATIFRNVPPPLCLTLAMTEKHEKAKRAELMKRHGFATELDAAYLMADQIEGVPHSMPARSLMN